jgi:2-haloacid dehalogenase
MEVYLTLDAFPEVPDVLRRLKAAGIRTSILSNGSPIMLASAVKYARLDDLLDCVLSVEEVGVYKPNPRVYQLAVDRLGIQASQISFQSSNAWDAYAASSFGIRSFGAIVIDSARSVSPANPTAKSKRWRNCQRSSGRFDKRDSGGGS